MEANFKEFFDFIKEVINFIDSSDVLINIFSGFFLFIVIGIFSWFSGIIPFIWRKISKPKLKIIESSSFCYIERFDEFKDKENCIRSSYIIQLKVYNNKNHNISIDSFDMFFKSNRFFCSYIGPIYKTAFPTYPRKPLGLGYKEMSVFFTHYKGLEEEARLLTMNGKINPYESQCGYLLFVSFDFGKTTPKIEKNRVKIKIYAELASGDILKCSAKIKIVDDKYFLEEMSPGILDQISSETSWSNHGRS